MLVHIYALTELSVAGVQKSSLRQCFRYSLQQAFVSNVTLFITAEKWLKDHTKARWNEWLKNSSDVWLFFSNNAKAYTSKYSSKLIYSVKMVDFRYGKRSSWSPNASLVYPISTPLCGLDEDLSCAYTGIADLYRCTPRYDHYILTYLSRKYRTIIYKDKCRKNVI